MHVSRATLARSGCAVATRVAFQTALALGRQVGPPGDLDLNYPPPLGVPWDAIQVATQAWVRAVRS